MDKIDFGEWKIPTSWDDIDLLTFQKINEYYSDKEKTFDIRDVLHILTNHTKDEISQLPIEFLDIIFNELSFLSTEPKVDEPSNKVVIDGETYQVNVMEKLKTGEWLALEMAMKENNRNYAAFLGILCRKENEIFDAKFENEVLGERIKFWERQPVTKIIPIIAFFLNLYVLLTAPSQLSMEVREAINQERQNIESLGKSGQVSKRTMRYARKTLKKLEKTINGI